MHSDIDLYTSQDTSTCIYCEAKIEHCYDQGSTYPIAWLPGQVNLYPGQVDFSNIFLFHIPMV